MLCIDSNFMQGKIERTQLHMSYCWSKPFFLFFWWGRGDFKTSNCIERKPTSFLFNWLWCNVEGYQSCCLSFSFVLKRSNWPIRPTGRCDWLSWCSCPTCSSWWDSHPPCSRSSTWSRGKCKSQVSRRRASGSLGSNTYNIWVKRLHIDVSDGAAG